MVSKKERQLLLGFAICFLALFAGAAASEIYVYSIVTKLQPGRIAFVADDSRVHLAGFHLMTPIVFLSLVFARKYIASTILPSFYGLLLIASYFTRLDGEGAFGGEGFYDGRKLFEFYNKSHSFDLAACVFVLALLIWQVSILIRTFCNKSEFYGDNPIR